ncbi:hypothetical protein BLNAU_16574 [Blattamonas nauphoetae]|uniref:Uncharacterized protein n=1 Tax=Blattamonas nauphoetae TaxID=2049346 RepID=A0ABQ9XE44_9EUKA|nr:hypothetical protein BLNAU_16574 [Blattamonas nauphoetae]
MVLLSRKQDRPSNPQDHDHHKIEGLWIARTWRANRVFSTSFPLTIKEQFFHRNTYSEVNGAAEEGTNQCQSDRDFTIAICDTSFGAVLQREERILLNNEDEAAQSQTVDQHHLQT